MNTKNMLLIGAVIIIILGFFIFSGRGKNGPKNISQVSPTPETMEEKMPQTPAVDPQNATYIIEGTAVTLVDGQHEESIPNSSTKIVTSYFGNEASGDLDGDGVEDMALLLTQDPGGSGTFFYVVASLKTEDGYVGTNGIMIGDRIAPQTTEINEGIITVNYSERSEDTAMTDEPSEANSKRFRVENGVLVELDNNNSSN